MYKNIYVIAPYAFATGGVELCHQLVDYLRNKGLNAFIVYELNWNISPYQDVTEQYSRYNIATCNEIVDSAENILILPEMFFNFINCYKNITIGCWWMSVDNHFGENMCIRELIHFKHTIRGKIGLLIKYFIYNQYRGDYSDAVLLTEKKRIFHFYQSKYAQYYLYSKGYSRLFPLSDYINTELISFGHNNVEKRENVVLYNPAKGVLFTQKLISYMPNVRFVALSGFSREELRTVMQSSKVYIDFGEFPGKDRLPREAVMNGCCVITGKKGASFFYEDVPISDDYKFYANRSEMSKIKSMVESIFDNFDEHHKKFDYYRSVISDEQKTFYKEIDNIFLNNNNVM